MRDTRIVRYFRKLIQSEIFDCLGHLFKTRAISSLICTQVHRSSIRPFHDKGMQNISVEETAECKGFASKWSVALRIAMASLFAVYLGHGSLLPAVSPCLRKNGPVFHRVASRRRVLIIPRNRERAATANEMAR